MIHYTIVKTNMFNGIPHPSLALWSKDDQLVMYLSLIHISEPTRH